MRREELAPDVASAIKDATKQKGYLIRVIINMIMESLVDAFIHVLENKFGYRIIRPDDIED